MENCKALVIGGSAGSLEVILKFLPDLEANLSFPIILVLHRKSGYDDILTRLLESKTELNVKEIEEKDPIRSKTIYIAPPNYHTLIETNQTFSLDASEKINFSRPSIDVTFESAAEVYRENAVSLLLSGANNDGTDGLLKIKKYHGKVWVQDPKSASVAFMPEFALAHVNADEILTPQEIANYINQLN